MSITGGATEGASIVFVGEPSLNIEEQIRRIVREEIAAHEERRHQEVTEFLAATEGLVRGTSGSQE